MMLVDGKYIVSRFSGAYFFLSNFYLVPIQISTEARGVCNGTGHNHLGKLLMERREELRKPPS